MPNEIWGLLRAGLARVVGPFGTIAALVALLSLGCSSISHKEGKLTGPPLPGQVILQWEADPSLRFNVYRRSENGNNIKVNRDFIKPLQAFAGGKALTPFQYVDRTVIAGDEYYYTLEQIDKDGNASRWETARKEIANPVPTSSSSSVN